MKRLILAMLVAAAAAAIPRTSTQAAPARACAYKAGMLPYIQETQYLLKVDEYLDWGAYMSMWRRFSGGTIAVEEAYGRPPADKPLMHKLFYVWAAVLNILHLPHAANGFVIYAYLSQYNFFHLEGADALDSAWGIENGINCGASPSQSPKRSTKHAEKRNKP